jgi:hypothetical protein
MEVSSTNSMALASISRQNTALMCVCVCVCVCVCGLLDWTTLIFEGE